MLHLRQSRLVVTLVLAALVGMVLAPVMAHAEESSETPSVVIEAQGVSDSTTDVKVQKLSSDTHEAVTGAHLQILEASTGKVVEDWTTDGSTKEFEKDLDVDTTYTLHEVSAPDGYDVAPDVQFTINATDGEIVLAGDTKTSDAEVVDKQTLNLYDVKISAETTVVTQQEIGTSTGTTTTASLTLPKTGDTTSLVLIGLIALVGGAVVAFGLRTRQDDRA